MNTKNIVNVHTSGCPRRFMLFHSIVAYWCAQRGYVSVISRQGPPPPPVEILASFVFTYKMNTTQTKLNFVG